VKGSIIPFSWYKKDVDLIKDGLDVISKWLVSNYKEDGFHDQ